MTIGRQTAALLHVGLDTIEFGRRRRYARIGLARGTVGLRGGLTEIVGVGDHIAKTARASGRSAAFVRHRALRAAMSRSGPGIAHMSDIVPGFVPSLLPRVAGRTRRVLRRTRAGAFPVRKRRRRPVLRHPRGGVARAFPQTVAPAWRLRISWRAFTRRLGHPAARRIGTRRLMARALCRLRLDPADRFLKREALTGDLGLAERRLHPPQLRDQRCASPPIESAARLAGGVGVQSGNGTGDERVVVCHPCPVGLVSRRTPMRPNPVRSSAQVLRSLDRRGGY